MKLECKHKASITYDKKILTVSQHTPVFSHVAPFCQVASCMYLLKTMKVILENLLSWEHTDYFLKNEKLKKLAYCLLHFSCSGRRGKKKKYFM